MIEVNLRPRGRAVYNRNPRWQRWMEDKAPIVIFLAVVVFVGVVSVWAGYQEGQRRKRCQAAGGVPLEMVCLRRDLIVDAVEATP